MTNNLAVVARYQQLDAAILAAKTPDEQIAAERALSAYTKAGDESGNFTVPRSDVPIVKVRFAKAAGDYKVARKPA